MLVPSLLIPGNWHYIQRKRALEVSRSRKCCKWTYDLCFAIEEEEEKTWSWFCSFFQFVVSSKSVFHELS